MISFKNNKKDMTIKEFLKSLPLSSNTITQTSKQLGILKINNEDKILKDIIYKGQTLEINLIETKSSLNIPKSNKLPNIIYEDDFILIVDKPNNLPTIPSFRYSDSLASQVMNHLGSGTFRAMNRLDTDTTGLVLIAKDLITENLLRTNGNIKKIYIAIVEGKTKLLGQVNAPIKDDPTIKKRIVAEDGDPAITYYKRLKYNKNKNLSLIKCHLVYGRTNQIRCHLSHISHPLQYDTKYGSKQNNQPFYLRCYQLSFIHPITNKHHKIKLDTIKSI